MSRVTGVVILRKTGKEKVYKEIKRIQFRQSDGSLNLSNTYKDTAAKKKNTAYSYIVVSYYSDALSGKNFVSHCSDWAAGQTSNSKLKNAYTAKINKTSASLQVKGTVKLKLTHKKPKTIYNSKSFRWYSDNTSIAKVSSKGVVTAVKPGTTTIRGRLPSGSEKTCKVTVVGAFKPSTPKIKVDVASNTTITLVWTKASHANSYLLYRSDDGINWNSPKTVKTTTYKDTGLTHNHRYTYYVVAVNNNAGYTAKSGNSNVIYQKAVIVRRKTTLSGWPTSKSVRSGNTYSVTVTIGSPDSRKGYLQMKSGSKWVTKKTFNLKKGAGTQKLKVTFPNDWWGKTTSWRFHIPKNNSSEEYTTKTLKITSTRRYQNPSKYVQISDTISKHGYSYYVSSVLVNGNSTKSDHIEALIKTANKYKGHKYKESGSGKPSNGVDSSGLIIQACYGAGVDLWPISPSTRPYNCVPKIRSSKLGKPSSPSRGDLVFFYLPGSSTIGHVGIYLGSGKIIHASQERGVVESTTVDRLVNEDGYKICDYRRIFN
jgi:cell wall-associated NlpC family hydrolase